MICLGRVKRSRRVGVTAGGVMGGDKEKGGLWIETAHVHHLALKLKTSKPQDLPLGLVFRP